MSLMTFRPDDTAEDVAKLASDLRERWSWKRPEIDRFKEAKLTELLVHAAKHSPYYSKILVSAGQRIDAVPPLDKPTLFERFDEIVTDPAIRRRDIEGFLSDP